MKAKPTTRSCYSETVPPQNFCWCPWILVGTFFVALLSQDPLDATAEREREGERDRPTTKSCYSEPGPPQKFGLGIRHPKRVSFFAPKPGLGSMTQLRRLRSRPIRPAPRWSARSRKRRLRHGFWLTLPNEPQSKPG